ncbi:MAG TPA: 2-amino-4-hydroxy-6-hydroxymethyldihydropteridine diphosphokinase [Solirubrobacteraceae bacterium]|nr:2-amino-4-hydroxy-6-hydroxymethyldihydropteridine diphosphokinase [Solirubrobacteraceae bacterium]
MTEQGYLGLGSNQGDRRGQLEAAAEALEAAGLGVLSSSSVYETEPVGEILDQPRFLNACLRIETDQEPEELFDTCKAVERRLGRLPGGPRQGPRPIDIDILLLGERSHASPRLHIPHPALLERRFVLIPMLELDFGARTPDGVALSDALAHLPVADQEVDLAGPPLLGRMAPGAGAHQP